MSEQQAEYKAESVVRFTAQVFKVQTTIDGGIRLTLDLSEAETMVAKQLMDIKRANGLLEVAAVPIDKKNILVANGEPELDKGKKRKSGWQTP